MKKKKMNFVFKTGVSVGNYSGINLRNINTISSET